MRRPIVSLCLLAGVAALLAGPSGCAKKLTGVINANQPPVTRIFVEGPVDTVNHLVHLHWYGTDADGYVRAYEFKLVNPADPVAADSAWFLTMRTDSVFTIFTPSGYAAPVLYVRAIDDKGARDPSPARQLFQFRNNPPIVKLITKPNRTDKTDSTYASVTVSWSLSDPDGDATKAVYHVWLDGNAGAFDTTTGTTFTVPSARFLQNGVYADGPRTLYVQAIDDGGMAGPPDSVRWYVRQPGHVTPGGSTHARLLLIDDVPRSYNRNALVDSLYANTAIRNLPAGSWSVLQTEYTQPFTSAKDLEQTLKEFDAVVLYRGVETTLPSILVNYEAGLAAYLSAGGKVFLSGLYLLKGQNAAGGLSEDFLTTYLDCYGFRKCYQTVVADSSAAWSNVNGSRFYSTMFADSSLQQAAPAFGLGGVRAFNVKHASDVALLGVPGALTPPVGDSLAVGVSVPQAGGGRAIVFTIPLEISLPLGNNPAPRFLAKIFAQLGLTGP
jgi:hypothetical protein